MINFCSTTLLVALLTSGITANAGFTYHKFVNGIIVTGNTSTSGPPVNATSDLISLADYNNGYLPFGTTNRAYNFDMKSLASVSGVVNSVSELQWAISDGVLPDGIALSTTGEITGVPQSVTTNNVKIKAFTPNGIGERVYTLTINNIAIMQANKFAAGRDFACAVNLKGETWCWGDNTYGQLGSGNNTASLTPVKVQNLPNDITDIAAGSRFVCAISTSQGLKCWGDNTYGQLGDNTIVHKTTPVSVVGLSSGVSSVSAGIYHACAVVNGAAKCWGYNSYFQLGNGVGTTSRVPVSVLNLDSNITQITSGMYFNCAFSSVQGLKCWGYNAQGQLGTNNTTNQSTATSVMGAPSDIAQIAGGGSHACLYSPTSGTMCWGANTRGQLGIGTTVSSSIPVAVSAMPRDVIALVGGKDHTCAVSSSQGVKCWGFNSYGQLGDGTTTARTVPTSVIGMATGAINVMSGSESMYTCASTSSQGMKCWGYNVSGQLGDGTTNSTTIPTSVVNP